MQPLDRDKHSSLFNPLVSHKKIVFITMAEECNFESKEPMNEREAKEREKREKGKKNF